MGIFSGCTTQTDQGNLGLSRAIADLQFLGYRLSIPLTENQKYDLIADKDDKLYKVQVKTTKRKSKYGIYLANLRTLGGNKSSHTIKKRETGDWDLLYVLTDENVSYLIPDDDIKATNAISLGKPMEKYIVSF